MRAVESGGGGALREKVGTHAIMEVVSGKIAVRIARKQRRNPVRPDRIQNARVLPAERQIVLWLPRVYDNIHKQ